MISSFFDKTKPITFVVVLVFLAIFFVLSQIFLTTSDFTPAFLVKKTVVFAILALSVFLVDFISKRNRLTGANAFPMAFFVLLLVMFPRDLTDDNVIICNFFLLLAIRRVISIRSLRNVRLKIFDATLWILVSSLFYHWSLLFMIGVFVAIYIYEPKKLGNWVVPLSAFGTFALIGVALAILLGDVGLLTARYHFSLPRDVDTLFAWDEASKYLAYGFLVICCIFISLLRMGKAGLGKLVTMRLMAFFFFVAVAVKLMIAVDTTGATIFSFFPAAVFFTNVLVAIKRKNIREAIFIGFVVLAPIIFMSVYLKW
ncbi:MAG: hypothetical protein AB3N16_11655 [Flavobacteriaceae bacterium]